MHRERSNQFLRSSDTDLRIDIASDRGCWRQVGICGFDALLRCKKIAGMAVYHGHDHWPVMRPQPLRGGLAMSCVHRYCACNSCQGRKCGVAATSVVDLQQYFESLARSIRATGKAAGIQGSPMRITVNRVSAGANSGHFRDNSAWANPVTDVRRACHDY